MKKLIRARPCVWDVTEKYLNKNDKLKLSFLQELPTSGSSGRPKEKIVTFEGDEPKVYTLGVNGDYWRNGLPLTSVLQIAANAGRSRVTII